MSTQPHPHIQAAYNLIGLADGTFAVEVSIPETHPIKVSGFDTPEKAGAWIERHKANIATGTLKGPPRPWGQRSKPG